MMSEPVPSISPALEGCIESCRRCEQILDRLESNSEEGRAVFLQVGPHLRHCLDHFFSFERGLESGVVEYDRRERDERLERDPGRFRDSLHAVARRLRAIDEGELKRSLEVKQIADANGREIVTRSMVERELIFLSGHTIHHLAIVAEIMRRLGVPLPEEFCLAFSTAAFRQTVG